MILRVFLTALILLSPLPAFAQTVKGTIQSFYDERGNKGKDPSKWADLPKQTVDWYKNQFVTPETKARLSLGYWSCCDNGDVFQTRFRLVEDGSRYGTETYEYFKDNAWRLIPPDVVQRKPTPDGRPRLFLRYGGKEPLCFIIDKEGI